MKHLKLFGNASELKAYVDGSDYLEPFVGTDSQGGGVVRYNRVAENIIRLFVDGSEDVMINKGNIEEGSSEIASLHPGWNILDMNGEFKEGFANIQEQSNQRQNITNVDFTKFTGKTLNTYMFYGTGLKEIIMSDTIEEIKEGCFTMCLHINKIKFSKNIKKIGPSAFNACYSLENINLPEGLEELEVSAFNSVLCTKLTLPSTIKKLGDFCYMPYNGTEHINGTVRFQSLEPPVMSDDVFAKVNRIEVPMAAVETYKNIDIPGWKENFGDKIVGY